MIHIFRTSTKYALCGAPADTADGTEQTGDCSPCYVASIVLDTQQA